MKSLYRYISLLLLCFTLSAAEAAPRFYILEDQALQLNADDALHQFYEHRFTAQAGHQFNPGFTKSVYWLAVQLDSSINPDQLRLSISQSVINEIRFYAVTGNTTVHRFTTGDHFLFSQRPFPTVDFTFPLEQHAYLYLLRIDKHNESLQLNFSVETIPGFIRKETDDSVITGALTGIIVLLLIFGFYLALITRQKIYIFYILYITAGWLWVLSDLGYGYKYLWPGSTWMAGRSRPIFADLNVALSLQYVIYYLGHIRSRWMVIMLKATSWFALACVATWCLPLNAEQAPALAWVLLIILPISVGVYVVLMLMTLVTESRHGNVMAKFYLAAIIPLMLLTLIILLNHGGVLNIAGSSLERFGVPLGYVCESVILTFGLVYRFNSWRLEKEQLRVAVEQQEKEKAKALLETEGTERRRIADELHDIAGSMLSAAKLNITSIAETDIGLQEGTRDKLQKAEAALNLVAGAVRNLSHALSPIMLDKVGFRKAVQNIPAFFTSTGRLKVELVIVGFEHYHPEMDALYGMLYSIVYESLNNIVKHSGADQAIIQLIEHPDVITAVIEDNGTGLAAGFDKENTKGLAGITSKIKYFNGNIEFDSSEQGLIISIEIPKTNGSENSNRG